MTTSEPIDLRLIAECYKTGETGWGSPSELMALVAAVRVARRFVSRPEDECPVAMFQALQEALAPFTDSAEVRSDGE